MTTVNMDLYDTEGTWITPVSGGTAEEDGTIAVTADAALTERRLRKGGWQNFIDIDTGLEIAVNAAVVFTCRPRLVRRKGQ